MFSVRATWVITAFVIFACAGCGSSTPDPVATFITTLDRATYKDCQTKRDAVARYLMTGQPTSFDAEYLDERTQVLKQPAGVQQAYMREYINALVADCDAVDQAAADLVAYDAACVKLGAFIATSDGGGPVIAKHDPQIAWSADAWKKGQCVITYYVKEIDQSLTYDVPLASNGAFDQQKYSYNRNNRCQGHPEDFYADTGVCVVVGFLG